MRRYGMLVGCGAVALLMGVMVSEAQVGGGKGKGGGRGARAGAGVDAVDDPVALLRRADVKKELEVTDEQMEKLPGAVMKAVGEVLNTKQLARFTQIDLQKRGTGAFKDAQVRKDLKITESQVKSIDEILADSAKEAKEIFKDAQENKNLKGVQEKIIGLNKETKEKIFGVLTADQKNAYKELVGEEFKFEKGGKGFGKKKDTSDK
jgi:hypothetical protein